mgnify:CR=1 FL=1
MEDGKYVVVRAASAGCFAGHLVEYDRIAKHVVLKSARRLWYWNGAASLSQLAMEGVTKPDDCKFSVPTDRHEIAGVDEVIDVPAAAEANLKAVPVWRR